MSLELLIREGGVGGAVSLGLLTRASSGWRRVIGTGSSGGSTDSSRGSARSKTVHFKRPALYRIVIFALWYGSGLWRIKAAHFFKGRASTESSFLGFGTGPGVIGRSKTAHF